MDSLLPVISMSELQKNAKSALQKIEHFAVIQSHGKDRALVLHPELGQKLIESGVLKKFIDEYKVAKPNPKKALKRLIGPVLRELSKR